MQSASQSYLFASLSNFPATQIHSPPENSLLASLHEEHLKDSGSAGVDLVHSHSIGQHFPSLIVPPDPSSDVFSKYPVSQSQVLGVVPSTLLWAALHDKHLLTPGSSQVLQLESH